MKKVFISLAFVFAVGLIFAEGILFTRSSSRSASNALEFSAVDLNGNAVSSKDIFKNNKITMINIWGTFCGPCISEMPELAKLNKANKSKGVEVIGIIIDVELDRSGKVNASQKKTADSIISKTGADYRHIVPSAEMERGFLSGVQAVPTTIFVDSEGRQNGDAVVGSRSQSQWQKIIDKLLK